MGSKVSNSHTSSEAITSNVSAQSAYSKEEIIEKLKEISDDDIKLQRIRYGQKRLYSLVDDRDAMHDYVVLEYGKKVPMSLEQDGFEHKKCLRLDFGNDGYWIDKLPTSTFWQKYKKEKDEFNGRLGLSRKCKKDFDELINAVNVSNPEYSLLDNNCIDFATSIWDTMYGGLPPERANQDSLTEAAKQALSATVTTTATVASTVASAATSTATATVTTATATAIANASSEALVAAKASVTALTKSAGKITGKIVAKEIALAQTAAIRGTMVTATETSKSVIQSIAPATVACFVGVAVALETAFSGYRVYKYLTDVNYLKEDLKLALIKGWTGTLTVVGVGIVGMLFSIGWWVLLPLVGVSFMITFLFKWLYKEKSYKEKVFIERGLNENSSTQDKKNEIRKIKKEILDKKLHPDKWPRDENGEISLDEKEKKKRMEIYIWLMSVKELIQEDIDNEQGLIEEILDEMIHENNTKKEILALTL